MYRVSILVTLFAAACGAAFAADGPKPKFSDAVDLLLPDRVLARGKGIEVKQSDVDDLFLSFKSHRAAMGVRVPEQMRSQIESDILQKLIATRLFLQKATDADRAQAKQTAEQFLADQMKQVPSEESFKRQLIAVGMTEEEFRAQIHEQAVVKAVIDREIKAKQTVTEEQIRAFYESNRARFKEPELVRVSHILISTSDPATGRPLTPEQRVEKQRLAEKILERVRSGENFVTLVNAFSDDAPSKARGGEYVIARAADDRTRAAAPEFEAAAFSLQPDQVSDIVTTRVGFHILKLHERIPAKPIELDVVKERIRETLLQEAVEAALPQYIDAMKAEAGVELLAR